MNLEYYLKKRDLLFARMSLMIRNKVLLIFSILIVCFLTFTITTGEDFHKLSLLARIIVIVFAAGFFSIIYLGFQLAIQLIMLVCGKNIGLLGAHKLEIKDEGLEESTSVNKSLHRWNPSFSVKEFGNYVWIQPTENQLFLIPKRQGGHEGNLAEFILQLKNKIGK